MSLVIPILLIVLIVCIELAAFLRVHKRRSQTVRENLEYERLIRSAGDRIPRELEHELRLRQMRTMDVHPLYREDRERLFGQWRRTQARFFDEPSQAVDRAEQLVQRVMQAQGYPVGNFDERAADMSVHHPRLVQQYRAARELVQKNKTGQASTEDLRQAMVYYRNLFQDLLEEEDLTPEPELKNA